MIISFYFSFAIRLTNGEIYTLIFTLTRTGVIFINIAACFTLIDSYRAPVTFISLFEAFGISDNAAEMQFCITNCTRDEAGFNSNLALALAHLSSLRDDPKTQMGDCDILIVHNSRFCRLSFPNYTYVFTHKITCIN